MGENYSLKTVAWIVIFKPSLTLCSSGISRPKQPGLIVWHTTTIATSTTTITTDITSTAVIIIIIIIAVVIIIIIDSEWTDQNHSL